MKEAQKGKQERQTIKKKDEQEIGNTNKKGANRTEKKKREVPVRKKSNKKKGDAQERRKTNK
jgi:hypothetical protein